MTPIFNLTPKQIEATKLLGSARHVMLYGGSRSAKTFTICRAVAIRAMKASGSRHVILRARFSHVRQSVTMDTFPKMMGLCFPEIKYELNKTDWYVSFKNGSEIWFGGLDDKERTEKILGKEFATICLNEASQMSYPSRNIAATRLAQKCSYKLGEEEFELPPRMYYDMNPPSRAHWSYPMFILKKDPITKLPLVDPSEYAALRMNPIDNDANLSPEYMRELEALPARMRARFMLGEYDAGLENALWTLEMLDASRESEAPAFQRVIIGVDPSGASGKEGEANDGIGISVCALGTDGKGYVIEDLTIKASPFTWGKIVATAFERHKADLVVGEANYGGAMVEHVIRSAAGNIPYKAVTATRGKVIRAEPIASLFEQGKIKLLGRFQQLEDELCDFSTTGYAGSTSPNRADAMVWAMTALFPGMTRVSRPKQVISQEVINGGAQGWMA